MRARHFVFRDFYERIYYLKVYMYDVRQKERDRVTERERE